MKQLIILTLLTIFPTAIVFAQTAQTIQAGFTVERELGETDRHIYEVNLTKGQMLNFLVEQRGVDVVLRFLTADGKFVDRVDSPNGREGDEPFKMVSLTGGRYRIEIYPLWTEYATTGKYFIKTVEIRAATNAELKATRRTEELLKIVAEDNRYDSYPNSLKRYYMERALITNPYGFTFNVPDLIELTTKDPSKLPEGASFETELSEVRLEDFGNVVVLGVSRYRRFKNPLANLDQTTNQRIGYVFKRVKGEWRIINVQRVFIERERKTINLDAKQLDTLVGVYDGGGIPAETLTIMREGGKLYGKFPEQEKFELFSEFEDTFVNSLISIAFVRNKNGEVSHAVVHYSMPDDRMTIQPKVK